MVAEFSSETALAHLVVAWLRADGWEVFQEVEHRPGFGAADIVAVRAGKVQIVECKLSFGLSVLQQAEGWRRAGVAHWVTVAAPWTRAMQGGLSMRVAAWLGVGVLSVYQRDGNVRMELDARLDRHARAGKILKVLRPEHQTFAEAGNNRSKRWSPFLETSRDLHVWVTQHHGCTLREALVAVKTHYRSASSARSALALWVLKGKVPGVRAEQEGRNLRLYPGPGGELWRGYLPPELSAVGAPFTGTVEAEVPHAVAGAAKTPGVRGRGDNRDRPLPGPGGGSRRPPFQSQWLVRRVGAAHQPADAHSGASDGDSQDP